jgi:KDO2-lipid IV(A) lauroyltransferase
MAGAATAPGTRTVRGRLLLAAARLLVALPEAPLIAAAESLGEAWYRIAPGRAAQARANLRRVCEGLEAQGRGTRLARRAATDPEALELLVRRCFRHAVRYYLEVARTGGIDPAEALRRMDVETPEVLRDDVQAGRALVLVGMHFGAIEMPIAVVAHLSGHRVTSPMETLDDPGLREWFATSRGRLGVDLVPLRNVRRALVDALHRGDSIGLVSDRDLTGSGMPVPLFGHPAPISPAPAMLALQTGAPVYIAAARRIGAGRYAGKLIRVPFPETGTRRDRVVALTTGIAAAFETVLADAPEQWWGAFHPIWPDLVVAGEGGPADERGPADDRDEAEEAGAV